MTIFQTLEYLSFDTQSNQWILFFSVVWNRLMKPHLKMIYRTHLYAESKRVIWTNHIKWFEIDLIKSSCTTVTHFYSRTCVMAVNSTVHTVRSYEFMSHIIRNFDVTFSSKHLQRRLLICEKRRNRIFEIRYREKIFRAARWRKIKIRIISGIHAYNL